ncbi:hypothetical protein K458DRAFT_424791 [Lentithecium fluviatile CBS 122367]|uniref:Uncharacterized protein n=1 Tax=Lentithecium fluviatile CBS 122367 TaxID=1168545 RepID=A0A6G1IEB7_9PLEO|nr:hypothetical protein K458DRAFT_424791 [Lentithecium fluviatile CBS 122367]
MSSIDTFPQFTRLPEELQAMIIPHVIDNELEQRNYRVLIRVPHPKEPKHIPRLLGIFHSNRFLRNEALRYCNRQDLLLKVRAFLDRPTIPLLFDAHRETLVFDCAPPPPPSSHDSQSTCGCGCDWGCDCSARMDFKTELHLTTLYHFADYWEPPVRAMEYKLQGWNSDDVTWFWGVVEEVGYEIKGAMPDLERLVVEGREFVAERRVEPRVNGGVVMWYMVPK